MRKAKYSCDENPGRLLCVADRWGDLKPIGDVNEKVQEKDLGDRTEMEKSEGEWK
jgi:hypothetical protein